MPVMYHVTSIERRRSIISEGLLADYDQTGFGAVFLCDCQPVQCEGFDVWAVDSAGLTLEEDFTGEPDTGRWWMHFGNIKPDQLSIHSV